MNEIYDNAKKINDIRWALLTRMESKDFEGYDPSAINFSDRFVAIRKGIGKVPNPFLEKLLRMIVARFLYYSGGWAVFFLKPKKKVYSKGLALILSGLSYQFSKNKNKIEDIERKLFARRVKGSFLWAHDLDYYFPGWVKVTTETPNLVTSAFVANAYFDLYMASECQEYKDKFISIVDSLLKAIPYKRVSKNEICFMYTPDTDYHVHNANLLYSELIAKRVHLSGLPDITLLGLVKESLAYTLNDFKKTNTYPYAGPPTRSFSVDNYHTGYVVRSLYEISKYTELEGELGLKEEIRSALNFYFNAFVHDYIYRDDEKTVQSHSLAEAVLVYSNLKSLLSVEQKNKFERSIWNTINILYHEEGYFINNVKMVLGVKIYDTTEMVRWSNSWMFYALSRIMDNDV